MMLEAPDFLMHVPYMDTIALHLHLHFHLHFHLHANDKMTHPPHIWADTPVSIGC